MITFCLGFRRWPVDHLHRCLRSLARFQRPVIVTILDDLAGARDALHCPTVLTSLRWIVHPRDEWSRAVALNVAARRAETPYICFTDADMLFPSSWLARAEACASPRRLLLTDSRDLDETTTSTLTGDEDEGWLEGHSVGHPRVGMGAAMVVSREWITAVHGFDEQMQVWGAEENDLVWRAQLDGLQTGWLTGTFVVHQWHRRDWCSDEQWVSVKRNRAILSDRIEQRGPVTVNAEGWGGRR